MQLLVSCNSFVELLLSYITPGTNLFKELVFSAWEMRRGKFGVVGGGKGGIKARRGAKRHTVSLTISISNFVILRRVGLNIQRKDSELFDC